jgi:hypothetical protein
MNIRRIVVDRMFYFRFNGIRGIQRPRVDFIKQFTPYTWNLSSALILLAQIYPNLASCICALHSTYCIFFKIWVLSTLYAVHPKHIETAWFARILSALLYFCVRTKGWWNWCKFYNQLGALYSSHLCIGMCCIPLST